MFGWFKSKPNPIESENVLASRLPLESRSTSSAKQVCGEGIRMDPQAASMIEEYRARYSTAPIGIWIDCVDEYYGCGFGGLTGNCSKAIFKEDGTGQCSGKYETILFQWRTVGERVIEVRCFEHIPPLEGYTEDEIAEDQQWYRVEYDFVVPQYVNEPAIFDVTSHKSASILDGSIKPAAELSFLECFCCLGNGPLQRSRELLPQTPIAI